jgi:hypothetical protein
MDFDDEVAESIAHLDASPHLIHKVDFSSLARSSSTLQPVSAPIASDDEDDGDDGDDEDLGLNEDQTADDIALRTRSSHGVRHSSSSLTREKSASIKPKAPSAQTKPSIKSLTENALRANKTLLIGRRIKIHFPNYGGSWGEVVSYDVDKDLYKIEFAVDSYVHYMTFEDVLTVLPNSWFGKQAAAHQARVVYSLARAAHAACYLGIGNKPIQVDALLSETFTEPSDYNNCCKAPDYKYWEQAMVKEITVLEEMGCWTIVKLTSIPRAAKLISSRWVYKLKYRDGEYERHKARLVALGYQQEKGRDYFDSFAPTCSQTTLRLVLALTAVPGWHSLDLDAVCAFISSDLAEGEHVYMKAPPGYDIGEGNCLSMNKCIYGLVQAPRQYYLLCREVYGQAGLQRLQTDECVFVRYVSNIKGQPQLTNEDLLINGKFLNMEFVPDKMRVYKSCSHPVAAMILVMYVDNNGIRHNCEELVQEFEKFVKMDGRINLQREGELDWFLSVRYSYCKLTGAICCSQEAYIHRLLVKYGMEHANPCKLPMNPGSDLDSLPILDIPDKLVVHAYAALIGELLYIAINTVPQLSYSMSCLTRYMSKATPAHLTYAKVVLRYLIGIKGRKLTWCGKRVSLPHVLGEILAYVDSSWADDKNNRRSSMAYYLFVNNATFSWRATLSQIVALSTTEAELMALASCCCEVVWARKLAVELGFPQLKPTDIYEDNTGCIALANNMHLRGRSKHVALRVCFIQQLIQDGIINAKQCPTAAQIADIGTKALPRVPFESFTDQLLGDKHVGGK